MNYLSDNSNWCICSFVVVAHGNYKTIEVFPKQAHSLSSPWLWADIFPQDQCTTPPSSEAQLWCDNRWPWSRPSVCMSSDWLW